eukprot:4422889-Prymnesium_polylepis.1
MCIRDSSTAHDRLRRGAAQVAAGRTASRRPRRERRRRARKRELVLHPRAVDPLARDVQGVRTAAGDGRHFSQGVAGPALAVAALPG